MSSPSDNADLAIADHPPAFVTMNCPACWDGVIGFVIPYPPPPQVQSLECPACRLTFAVNIESRQ